LISKPNPELPDNGLDYGYDDYYDGVEPHH